MPLKFWSSFPNDKRFKHVNSNPQGVNGVASQHLYFRSSAILRSQNLSRSFFPTNSICTYNPNDILSEVIQSHSFSNMSNLFMTLLYNCFSTLTYFWQKKWISFITLFWSISYSTNQQLTISINRWLQFK